VVEGVLNRALRIARERREPLGLIGLQKGGPGLSLQDMCDLPTQVVDVMDGAV